MVITKTIFVDSWLLRECVVIEIPSERESVDGLNVGCKVVEKRSALPMTGGVVVFIVLLLQLKRTRNR